jgi:hypothetical protein
MYKPSSSVASRARTNNTRRSPVCKCWILPISTTNSSSWAKTSASARHNQESCARASFLPLPRTACASVKSTLQYPSTPPSQSNSHSNKVCGDSYQLLVQRQEQEQEREQERVVPTDAICLQLQLTSTWTIRTKLPSTPRTSGTKSMECSHRRNERKVIDYAHLNNKRIILPTLLAGCTSANKPSCLYSPLKPRPVATIDTRILPSSDSSLQAPQTISASACAFCCSMMQ